MPKSIFDLTGEWMRLMEATQDVFNPEDGTYVSPDPADVEAAFAALGESVTAKLAGCGHVRQRLKADAAILKAEEQRLAARRRSLDAGRERLEQRMRELMELTDTTSVKTPSITVSLSKPGTRVEITDDIAVPLAFRKPPVLGAPILKSIKMAIESGAEVPGAALVASKRRLTIR
jgi:hypothetical protein